MSRTKNYALLLSAALAVLAGGCASAPRYRVEVGGDIVRAPDPEVAADVAVLLEQGRALLEGQVAGLEDTAVEVWVQDPTSAGSLVPVSADHSTAAYTLKSPGQKPRIYVSIYGYRDTLQHELAHALLGEDWRTLPFAPEEGLCTLLNDDLAGAEMLVVHLRCAARAGGRTMYHVSIQVQGPDGEPTEHTTFWGNSGGSDASDSTLTVAEILALSSSGDLRTMTSAEVGHVYGVGLLVVLRIVEARGIEGLHELCLRATSMELEQVPVAWLLDAAGIQSDEQFQELAHAALRSESLRSAFESDSFQTALRAAIQEASLGPADSADAFFGRFEGALKINGEPEDLKTLPEFRSWIGDNWGSLRTPVDG